ncbi:MAG: hypothetical protein K8S14_08385 [Actinomycetia bacterium]|nr:hypothetical protein [Actinomycetes bacterium]
MEDPSLCSCTALDLWEDPKPPPQPLEMVCEPDAEYIPWENDVPEIEVG